LNLPRRKYLSHGLKPAFWLCLVPCAVFAQTAPPAPPTAGSLLQQLQPLTTKPPTADTPAPKVKLPKAVSAPTQGGPKLQVKGFRLAGLDAPQVDAMLPLLQKYLGPDKSLADLEDAAKDVEVALQRSGFFLAQAYVPEQTIADGMVTLQVLIGRLGAIKLEVEPGVKVSPDLMDQIVARLRGNPVAERELIERALFTLGDLRGITISSSLTPGERVGQADLTIKVARRQNLAYNLEFDNGGSIFTGRYRINAGVDWFSPAGRGDVASLKTQFSTNAGTRFLRASWLTPINAQGTKLGLAASFLHYSLGSIFESLDADGTAAALSLQLLHPQIRSRNSNLFLQMSADVRKFEDKVKAVPLDTKKGVTSYFTFGAVGDFRDTRWGGGITNYSANIVTGRLKITSPDDLALDQSADGYKAAGSYAKLMLAASRLQTLPNKDALYFSANAQIAGKDLDSSEKFSLGGPYGVRGYAPPESPSDSGLIVSWEYRKPMRFESTPGDFVFGVFGDYGIGQLHHTPLPADTENIRRLVSHGFGVTYDNDKGLFVKAWLAARGGTRAQSDDSRARLYVLLGQQF